LVPPKAVVDADQFEALEDQILRAAAVALQERRFLNRLRLFAGVD
jgi:hypothetical protein